jgi:16S rRNA (adenine1518-N6/adenine1519-N6)-dimethyltransferase
MALYQPTELIARLQRLGVSAKKGLSQNFLIDGNIIRKIVQTAQAAPGDLVIEIGPGPGALTEALLSHGCRVIAIEKDRTFAAALSELQTPDNRLEVIEGDFLTFPLEEHLKTRLKSGEKGKVIANLPYHITTPILAALIPMHALLSTLTVMVQKEVGKRFVAEKGTTDYSSFTLFLQFFAHSRYAFTVEPTCFIPPPKIQSAVMHLTLHQPREVLDSEALFAFIRHTFQKRRKMLRASLKELYSAEQMEKAFKGSGIAPETRPEQLSLDDFIRLFDWFVSSNRQ